MANIKHGFWRHPVYRVWEGIKSRCYNTKLKHYKDYGGRGITVCDEWINNSKAFIEWAFKNGWEKGLKIDRINVNGDYSPKNCRFVDAGLNARNRRLLRSDNTSGYSRAYFNKKNKNYWSFITINGKQTYLGSFSNIIEAAMAYDKMAIALNDGRPTNFE